MIIPSGPVWQRAAREKQWLIYRLVDKGPGRKPGKMPTLPDHPERSFDRATAACLTFSEAKRHAEALGLPLGTFGNQAMVVVDLDGVLKPPARPGDEPDWRHDVLPNPELYLTKETYVEVSPSGTGLHILLPREGWPTATYDISSDPVGYHGAAVNFVAITLNHIEGPREVRPAPRLMAHLLPLLQARIAERERETQEAAGGADPETAWFPHLTPEERVDATRELLAHLPKAWVVERDLWLKATFALHSYPELYEAWDAWCKTGGAYDAGENEETWTRGDRGEGALTTVGTLIAVAREGGADLSRWVGRGAAGRAQERMQRLAGRLPPHLIEEAAQRAQEEPHTTTRAEAEARGELVFQNHSDPEQAWREADMIEVLLGGKRLAFALGGAPHYIRGGAVAMPDPETDTLIDVVMYRLVGVKSWATLAQGHVRYQGVRGPIGAFPAPVEKRLAEHAGKLLPALRGILQAPAIMPTGELLTGGEAAHYDEASRLWVAIPLLRGRMVKFEDAEHALAWLEGVWLAEFAFDSREDCARALTMLGSLLTSKTLLGEDAGPPAYMFTAPQASTGKTVLACAMVSAVTGISTPVMPMPREEDEMRKVLLAQCMVQRLATVFDNVERGKAIHSDEANSFVTATELEGRVLGETRMLKVDARMLLAFTGNAVVPSGDMMPRVVTVKLRWKGEGQANMRRFEREDITRWSINNRAIILSAMHTVLSAPLRKGWDEPVGRFPTWSRVVLQPIAQAFGMAPEALMRDWLEASAEDEISEDFAPIAEAMHKAMMQHGSTLSYDGRTLFTCDDVRSFCAKPIARLTGSAESDVAGWTARKVSSLMTKFDGLHWGNFALVRERTGLGERSNYRPVITWRLELVAPKASREDEGAT